MKKKYSLIITLFSFSLFANSITINGTFNGYESEKYVKVLLANLSQNKIIQSEYLNEGKLLFKIENNLSNGIYRLHYSSFDKKGYFDVIIENESIIHFTIDINSDMPSPKFLISKKNIEWYEYKKEIQNKISTIDKLTYEIAILKKNHILEKEKELNFKLINLKNNLIDYKKKFIEKKKFSIVSLYEKNFHPLFSNPYLTPKENLNSIKNSFFIDVSFHESLVNTTLYNDLFYNYFSVCKKIDKNNFERNLAYNMDLIPIELRKNNTIEQIISNTLNNYFLN